MAHSYSFSETMKTSTKTCYFLAWLLVIGMAGVLRMDKLSDRAFHFDEATGARITAQRLDHGTGYQFNPVHNHGPLLSAVAEPLCRLNGESSWKKMTKLTLRLVPAVAGTILVMIPLLGRRRFGNLPMLVAATMLATSPLLVYYSRMFIHEMLLALCGLATAVLLCSGLKPSQRVKYGVLGALTGLMFATKESFAISIIAWSGAALLLALSHHRELRRKGWRNLTLAISNYRTPIVIGLIAFTLTTLLYYTNGLSNPQGAWDAVKTFFIYKTEPGHDKTFTYYFEMLALPSKAGIWWFETPVMILAMIAMIRVHLPGAGRDKKTNAVRFLSYSAVIHFLIYGAITYKTPWLMCLPWAHVCLLAGLSLRGISTWCTPLKLAAIVAVSATLFQQTKLTRFATGRFASDSRNPYAYAPTSRDVESFETWMSELSGQLPPGALEPVAVVGAQYWPLPWYLRDFEAIGYWPEPAPEIDACPLILAMPEVADELASRLKKTHIALPRTLRSEVTLMMFLRRDHWNHWMSPESQ